MHFSDYLTERSFAETAPTLWASRLLDFAPSISIYVEYRRYTTYSTLYFASQNIF